MGGKEGVVGHEREGKEEGRWDAEIVIVYASFCCPIPLAPSSFECAYVDFDVAEVGEGINECLRSLVTSTSVVLSPEKAGMGMFGRTGLVGLTVVL